jgi:hypothetical protein
MRRTKLDGGFFLCLLINMLLNLEGTIPAWILLILHFLCDWSILWFWLALGAWALCLVVGMLLIRFANRCSTPDPPKENKNPYSVGAKKERP